MAVTASSTSTGPRFRYAPEDPTVPKPWKVLVDRSTGYLYFWNTETNVTQYERPVATSLLDPVTTSLLDPISSPRLKSASSPINTSAQIEQPAGSSLQGHQKHEGGDDDAPRQAAVPAAQKHPDTAGSSSYSQSVPRSTNAGYGEQTMRSSAAVHVGGGSSFESYCRQHEITVIGNDVPSPFMTFESTGFPSTILKEVRNAGFSAPTPIQAQSWPIALRRRDIVAVAKTGSGKTLGYLIPGFIHLKVSHNNSIMGPTVLVLSPTRELATQIQDEAVKFGRSSGISCTCLYGGAPKGPQLKDLSRGTDIVVATPGRLNDILEMKRVSLHQVSYLVLDEADRMLDMGFEPQIRKIVKEIPTRRQTLMYTATWPKEVRKIAADLLVNPVQVNIGNIDELVANKSITQYIEVMTSMEKNRRLEQILRSQEPGSKVIIFCSTKKMCDQLARNITRQFGAASIHGDKSQSERDMVLNEFRTGKSPILVATDVAARGLDIKDIRAVVNYDFPTGIEDYVHRIGRTGRAGATGVAHTFFCDQDAKHASDLIKVLEGASQQVPSELREMVGRGGGMGRIRRWGSGSSGSSGREGGQSYGGGSEDYGNGGGSSWGSLSSGWSERANSDRGHDPEPCNRYDSSYDQAKYNAREEDAHGRHHQGFCGDNNGNRATDVRRTQIDNTGPDSVLGPYSQNRSRSPPLRRGMIPTDEGGAW